MPKTIKKTGVRKNPCWPTYVMVGMKVKNGKACPNCVPQANSTRIKSPK